MVLDEASHRVRSALGFFGRCAIFREQGEMVIPGTYAVGLPSSLGLRARMALLASSTLRRKSGDRPTHTIRYQSTHNLLTVGLPSSLGFEPDTSLSGELYATPQPGRPTYSCNQIPIPYGVPRFFCSCWSSRLFSSWCVGDSQR